MKHKLALSIFAIVALIASACSATGDTSNLTIDSAPVDTVNVILMESLPTQAQIVTTGVLPDSCTLLGEANIQQSGNRFNIALPIQRDLNQACAQVLAPFEETIPLDLGGLAAGEYIVDVNGVEQSFTFESDSNVPPGPTTTTEVTWEEAKQLILNGQVTEITQFHSLKVSMLLRNGNLAVSTEPEIDAVLRVLDECDLVCSDVKVATE